jgi:flagellar protein FlbD
MITLTRLGGHALAVNPDLIERAESTPDTVLTMIDGHKIVVAETLDEVVELVRTWRASVAAQAYTIARASSDGARALTRGTHPSSYPSTEILDEDDEVGAHTAIQASLARVLRLPQRGE